MGVLSLCRLGRCFLLLVVRDRHENMAGPLGNAVASALGARLEALERHGLFHENDLHLQLVDVGAVVVLRVGDRRFQYLLDDVCPLLRTEGEQIEGLFHREPADLVGDEPPLLGRKPYSVQHRAGFHASPYFFSPPAAGAAAAGAAPGAGAPGAVGAPGAPGPPPPALAAAAASRSFLSAMPWLLKMRVSANSPSLCPTMFSVTYTGTCCLPLCTAIVRPMKSGTIVERRDQVLIGRLSFPPRALSTLAIRWWSTKGPFLTERAMLM